MSSIIYTIIEEVKYDGFGIETDRYLIVKWRHSRWYKYLFATKWISTRLLLMDVSRTTKFHGLNAALEAITEYHTTRFVTTEKGKTKEIEYPLGVDIIKPSKTPSLMDPNEK